MDVILVDEQDLPIGEMEKLEVHQKALLHRAFSVFIFNQQGQMLLQQRAADKYHCPLLWTNACCSHPAPHQDTLQAAEKRLMEEMGFTTPLKKIFDFIYKAAFDNGLTEHEFDHVFVGQYDGAILPNAQEVNAYAFQNSSDIAAAIQAQPDQYTEWFKIAFPKVRAYFTAENKQDLL